MRWYQVIINEVLHIEDKDTFLAYCTRRSLHETLKLAFILQPRPTLILSGAMNALSAPQSLNIKISDPASSVTAWQWNADFMLSIKHHIILPQPSLAIINTKNPLLHLHLLRRRTPRKRIILSSLGALTAHRPGKRNAILRVRQSFSDLADGATAGDVVATPDVLP